MLKPEESRPPRTILLKVERPGRYVGGESTAGEDWNNVRTKVARSFRIFTILVCPMSAEDSLRSDQSTRRRTCRTRLLSVARHGSDDAPARDSIILARIKTRSKRIRSNRLFPALRNSLHHTLTSLILPNSRSLRGPRRNSSIIIAGGHAATNPEPMHAFIDAFVIARAKKSFMTLSM